MSLCSSSITYLLVIIISLTCQSLQSIPIRTEQSKESFIQNTEEFIPTDEWQTVKEGQAVPAGLHIRLNLETGIREAKLLEDNKPNDLSNSLVPVESNDNEQEKEQEQHSKQNLERAFANLDFSKDDVIPDEKHDEEVRKKFRPYEELKKDLESMHIKIQTDQEILTDLIDQLKKVDDDDNRHRILTDLEYYLHQYDNAILFSDMNGIQLLLQLLNSTNTNNDIRQLTCLALGAAFQGNPKVQVKGLNLGVVQYLLRLITTEIDNNIKFRLLFTLSTLLRHLPQSQMNFLQHGGVETMINILDDANLSNKMKMRVIQLMNDLIVEKDQVEDDKREIYENIHIRNQLVERGWCSRLSTRLTSIDLNDFDQIEKTLMVMMPITDVCRIDFVPLLPILDKLNDIYTKTNDNEDSTHIDILHHIQNLRNNLQEKSSIDL